MRACPVCGNSTNQTDLWNMSNIARCSVCGLGYVKRLPTLEELAAIYAADYWNGRKAYTDYLADKVGTQLHFKHRIASLRNSLIFLILINKHIMTVFLNTSFV